MNTKGGFVQLLIILVLIVIILSLLGVSISSVINNKTLQENFAFLWNTVMRLWQMYVARWF